jgi:hypothetical protein
MLRFKTALSVLSIRSVITAQPPARVRRWGAGVATSLVLLACGAPAELDLGRDESALQDDLASDDSVSPGTLLPVGSVSPGTPVTGTEPDFVPCTAVGTTSPAEPEGPAVEPTTGVEPTPEEAVPSVEPDVPSVEPDVPSVEPDVPSVEPDVPSVEPDVPSVEPDVPSVEPDVPTVEPDGSTGGTYPVPCPAGTDVAPAVKAPRAIEPTAGGSATTSPE